MKTLRILTFLLLILTGLPGVSIAQIFEVDTIQLRGSTDKFINIVVLGDGYTADQQDVFSQDAKSLTSYLFQQKPWVNYVDYFNIFAVRVISAESGAKHPNTASDCSSASVPVSNPNNFLGCTFDAYNIHRLLVPFNFTNIAGVLAANAADYDQVLIISNSPYYGGSGGSLATSSKASSSNEIVAHEIGHSFADLADEYFAGDQYLVERPNMTKETDPGLVKWKNWVGTDNIGINQYCCGGNSASWYKPSTGCKMQFLGPDFCAVCTQQIIESIHDLVNPIVAYEPIDLDVASSEDFLNFKLSELMKPIPNTLNIKWDLDGVSVAENLDSFQIDQSKLQSGEYFLTATIIDTSSLLRVDNHSGIHYSNVTWTINKTSTGTGILSANNQISCNIYPNPTSSQLRIELDIAQRSSVSINLSSLNGQLIRNLMSAKLEADKHIFEFNVEDLASGIYQIQLTLGNTNQVAQFIKQ